MNKFFSQVFLRKTTRNKRYNKTSDMNLLPQKALQYLIFWIIPLGVNGQQVTILNEDFNSDEIVDTLLF
ncbi:MAG: hypothetical protein D8M58_15560 [Calditrichaeota bacterium]|nr:MAG: hypothetical protein DWQ03_07290 [Calditrichota bacterium]MBL1206821.1 hypothetical protein [Calditrichota bacterium]